MKILYIVIFLALFSLNFPQRVNAQTYEPVAKDGAHWIVKQVGVMEWFVLDLWEYYCQSDTIIDGTAYKKVFRRELETTQEEPPFTPVSYYNLFGFLRDDTASREVYGRIPEENNFYYDCPGDQDILIFDFAVQPTDSIYACTTPSFYEATLESISTGDAFGVTTQIYTINNGFEYYEGIGSQFGLFEEMFLPVKSGEELEHNELYYYCPSDPCPYVLPDVTLLTVGEVFDFEIGDEFQYNGEAAGQTPNADRITITGKFYSQENDTVFYEFRNNWYSTAVNWDTVPPTLEYFFGTIIDTLAYTNLQQPISTYDNNFFQNVNIYNSTSLCDSLVNRYKVTIGPSGMPNDYYIKEFGKGLGLTFYYVWSGDAGTYLWNYELFYYKKGNNTCGEPDVVKAGNINIEPEITIYPNPADKFISFTINQQGTGRYTLLNTSGVTEMAGSIYNGMNTIYTGKLTPGIYFLQLILNDKIEVTKIVIK